MNDSFENLPDEKRARIVNAAIAAFADFGYRKASTGDIAKESGISKSLLFHYFGSKAGLFAYAFDFAVDRVAEGLRAFEYRDKEDLFEMIRRSNVIKLGIYRAHPRLYAFVYKSYYEDDPEAARIVAKRNGALVADSLPKVLARMDVGRLRPGLDPEAALRILLWVSDGFLQERLRSGDVDPDALFTDFDEVMKTLRLGFYR